MKQVYQTLFHVTALISPLLVRSYTLRASASSVEDRPLNPLLKEMQIYSVLGLHSESNQARLDCQMCMDKPQSLLSATTVH